MIERPGTKVPDPYEDLDVGHRHGWALALIYQPMIDFDKSIIKYPNITRYVGGASFSILKTRCRC
jgi:hypothetical protein